MSDNGINECSRICSSKNETYFSYCTMKNISALLTAAGSDISKVVKTTVFIKNMDDFAAINAIYAQYINGDVLPARSCVEVARLPKDVLLECEVIAEL